jgi:hypothetical protein
MTEKTIARWVFTILVTAAGFGLVHVPPAHVRVLAVPSNDDCTTCYNWRHHRRRSNAITARAGISQNPSVPRS